jgi:hypothetical protein
MKRRGDKNGAISGKEPEPCATCRKGWYVLYSNVAGEPLLHKWDVAVGEKLPSSIGEIVYVRAVRKDFILLILYIEKLYGSPELTGKS